MQANLTNSSTSKLPVRRNVAPIFRRTRKLEDHLEQTLKLSSDKIYKKFSSDNVAVTDSESTQNPTNAPISKEKAEIVTRKNWKAMLEERDEQIDKLIGRLRELHGFNVQFAAENDRLQQQHRDATEHLTILDEKQRELHELHRNETQQLGDDVKMMKTLVYRLNVQLERHQDLLRNSTAAGTENPIDFSDEVMQQTSTRAARPVLDWGRVNAHTLGPLLQAYTEIISDKNDLVQQYEAELGRFTGRLKDVLAENERLHDEMDAMRRQDEMWSGDKTRLQAQLEIYRSKAEVATKRSDLTKEKLVEVLRCYEQKVQSQHLDVERLQEAYSRAKGELTAIRNMQQNPEVMVESLKECQRVFEELKVHHDKEKTNFQADCEILRSRVAELEEQARKARLDSETLRTCCREKQDENDSLNKKINELRQSLARIRMSRESFRSRLKSSVNLAKNLEGAQERYNKNSWQQPLHSESQQQRETHVQSVHARYLQEIERLTRKLQQRDDTLKKVLQAKVRTARVSATAAAAS